MGEKNFFGVSLRAFANINEQNIEPIDLEEFLNPHGMEEAEWLDGNDGYEEEEQGQDDEEMADASHEHLDDSVTDKLEECSFCRPRQDDESDDDEEEEEEEAEQCLEEGVMDVKRHRERD